MIVLCPTRGRPGAAQQMWWSLMNTATLPDTRLILVVDRDDPKLSDYLKLPSLRTKRYGMDPDEMFVIVLEAGYTGDLVKATNSAARRFWDQTDILGHVGDDHRFNTKGWDALVRDALTTPGIAYGDDLLQGVNMPTAVFMSAEIPRALGWYALPTCRHLFIDNAWKALGERLGVLHYLPEVVIEHVHPAAGKADWDDGYRAANSSEMFDHDRRAFEAWDIDSDLARVTACYDLASTR